jgi:hypothetical protein
MAVERATVRAEATATLERHVSRACSGTGNMSVGTRGVLGGGGHWLPLLGPGDVCPYAPLWSKIEVGRVMVSPVLSER